MIAKRILTCIVLGAALIAACDSRGRGETHVPAVRADAEVAIEDPAPREPEPVLPPAERELEAYLADIPGDGPRLFASIETDAGLIECELYPKRAPRAVASFVGLATGKKAWRDPETDSLVSGSSFFEGVAFHYVIPGFFIQTGDRTGTGKGGPGYTFEDEFSPELRHDQPGTLSMANSGPDTNGSQFFITERALPHLDGRHTIFGRCSNLEVVGAISRLPTTDGERPEHPARIVSITFEERP